MVVTGVPKLVVIEMPELNVRTRPQYVKYWEIRLPW
jgi:hypothetical protein